LSKGLFFFCFFAPSHHWPFAHLAAPPPLTRKPHPPRCSTTPRRPGGTSSAQGVEQTTMSQRSANVPRPLLLVGLGFSSASSSSALPAQRRCSSSRPSPVAFKALSRTTSLAPSWASPTRTPLSDSVFPGPRRPGAGCATQMCFEGLASNRPPSAWRTVSTSTSSPPRTLRRVVPWPSWCSFTAVATGQANRTSTLASGFPATATSSSSPSRCLPWLASPLAYHVVSLLSCFSSPASTHCAL
jgi:hypothetical protein